LVTIGILGLVAALVLPAVQSARESARRAQCQNNLHQIGIALHGYHAQYQSFPSAITNGRPSQDGEVYLGLYSVHCRILPFLDQQHLFNSINFEVGTWAPDSLVGGKVQWVAWNSLNSTVYNTSLTLFLCPSDGGPLPPAGNNYRGNAGVGPNASQWIETPDSGNGVFPEIGTVSMKRIIDGLTHTVAFSERVRGTGAWPLDPARDSFRCTGIVNTADQLLLACRIATRASSRDGFIHNGHWWFWTGRERTLFNHAQSPNGRVPDCTHLGSLPAGDMFTARSDHPGGVNALMADGSLRFVSENISQAVWRGLGTRNGRELVD
jgi:prepilin-type processing-associated H-X9-DG protein